MFVANMSRATAATFEKDHGQTQQLSNFNFRIRVRGAASCFHLIVLSIKTHVLGVLAAGE